MNENELKILENLEKFQPDALVLGLGPSLQLVADLPFEGIRLFGVNDILKHRWVHDLVVVDRPNGRIHIDRPGSKYILNPDKPPERWWIRERVWMGWKQKMSDRLWDKVTTFRQKGPTKELEDEFTGDIPYQVSSSVTATSIAWACGYRRIGLIGVDHINDGVNKVCSPRNCQAVSSFLSDRAREARERGGAISILSPISQIHIK